MAGRGSERSNAKKSLRYLKGQLTRAETKAKAADSYNVYSLRHFLDELEKDYNEIVQFYESKELSEAEEAEFFEVQDKYDFAQARFKEIIDRKLNRTANESFDQSAPDNTVKDLLEKQNQLFETICALTGRLPSASDSRLPALKIPQFSGDYCHWMEFKNLFLNRIGGNKNLSNVEKLGHLLTLLSGEAAGLVKYLQLDGDNYMAAWEALEEKYDRPYRIAVDIIKSFKSSMSQGIRLQNVNSFYGSYTETFLALDNLSDYSNNRDVWILNDIVERFDKFLKERWVIFITGNSEPSIEDMQKFLGQMSEVSESRDAKNESSGGDASKSVKNVNHLKGLSAIVSGCFVCGDRHKIFHCSRFRAMSIKDREKVIKDKNRCLNCFGTDHFSTKCVSKGSCFHCRKKHHTLLHYDRQFKRTDEVPSRIATLEPGKIKSEEDGAGLVKVHFAMDNRICSAILPTAVVELRDGLNKFIKVRALLDCGAQASFIKESCCNRLGLSSTKTRIPIQFMSGSNCFTTKGAVTSMFRSCVGGLTGATIHLHVLSKISDRLPERKLYLNSSETIKSRFELADPCFDDPADIDLIIGADHFFSLIGPGKYYQTDDNIWILESSLGWLVGGGAVGVENDSLCMNSVSCSGKLDDLLEKFWSLEEMNIDRSLTNEEQRCEELFEATTVRDERGRYCVDLPFREPRVLIGDSYRGALNRFSALERRFQVDPDYAKEYHGLMSLFLDEGYMEIVPEKELSLPVTDCFYLPHYGICKSHNKSKLRIVFDASAKSTNGISLNDCISAGPKYQNDIFRLLIEFRRYRFVFTADIVKMYRQIRINENHRNFQRFLWRWSNTDQIAHYRLTTLMDGVNAAPYLALRTMLKLAVDEKQRFPKAAGVMSSRYMDDFFIGSDSVDELVAIQQELREILASANMKLDKWATNDVRVLDGIGFENYQQGAGVEVDALGSVKTLGVNWCHRDDVFTFKYESYLLSGSTKRCLLSESARVFDPCGWISPVVVLLKVLFQNTWLRRVGWDEELPVDIKAKWFDIRGRLESLSVIKIPRWVGPFQRVEIHGFCDSSTVAYAAVIYLVTTDVAGVVRSRLLVSKTKLCPIKPVSIARLELCGAQLLARLLSLIRPIFSELEPSFNCWSDSKTALAWIAAHPSRWKSFVANRCAVIHDLLPDVPWRYVKSEGNPADIASRGMLPDALSKSDMWWFGPPWVVADWRSYYEVEDFETIEEGRSMMVGNLVTSRPFFIVFVERFSCFDRFRRSFCYFVKFLSFIRYRAKREVRPITADDISNSTLQFIKLLQLHNFAGDMSLLRDGKAVSKSSRLIKLSPFLDSNGILRVGGRLASAFIGYGARHPIIVPCGHFLRILVKYVHQKYYHSGARLTLSLLRQNYYVFRVRSVVKAIISECIVCRRFKGETYHPVMGDLPESRVKFEKPFSVTGVDFAGPIMTRPHVGRGKMTVKGYVAVFVCMATRAVHLELVSSLSTGALIMALKRFVSKYGHCEKIVSDNGRNFVGCARAMKDVRKDIEKSIDCLEVKSYLLESLISWEFIPPYSPHFGGLWEAAVRSAKFHLSRVFVGRVPTLEEMSTALAEISAILNSRPLSALTNSIEDFGVLTPSHLVSGYPSVHLPILASPKDFHESSNRYNKIAPLIKLFWRSWQNEYLQDFQKKVKWNCPGRGPEVGDLVLLRRINEVPALWSRGRIIKLHPGKDGRTRVVDVKTKGGTKVESIRNLVPLLLKHDASMGGVC